MELVIVAHIRKGAGKGVCRKLRKEGKIPAILYGKNEKNINLWVDEREFLKILPKIAKRSPVLNLKIEEENQEFPVILKALQKNPINQKFIHIDFQKIHPEEKIIVNCPVVLKGTPIGVKMGGILDQHLYSIPIKGKIADIPPYIEIDISNLKMGYSIHINELNWEKIEPVLPPDTPILSILTPKKIEEIAPTAEEVKEPEVIKEKKEEKEEEE
ncbi:MAG: 50S ribosomal protein L25 [candidate division WOR-3 bacterium]|nr:50S ribosomal protein L25 [candidate division WOR-3 bacterium]MCX7837286.1 50S ribosomal protein L25 [candidate division WOR-3 bacterium]MDW8113951.1 50S ribosomal protein L25 [candidate division WOR-3 bacterium]